MQLGTIKEYALAYSRIGFQVFPCYSIDANGKCSCGKSDCERDAGKHPRTQHGLNDATSVPLELLKYFGDSRPTNIGLATGQRSNVLVIDVDDPQALIDLESKYGKLPVTVTAISGRGCPHYYFRYNPSFENVLNSKLLDGTKKIDVRCNGGYVVMPPSKHKSGNEYLWLNDPLSTPLADAPSWLVALLPRKTESKAITQTLDAQRPITNESVYDSTTFTIHDPDSQRVACYLANVPPAISGQGGMNATFQVCCRMIELFGNIRTNEQLLDDLQPWNETCIPPWQDHELERKIRDARTKTGIEYVCHEGTASDLVATTTATVTANVTLPWPSLNDHGLHGLAGEIVQRIEPQSETDPVALLVTLLTSFGVAVGRSPHFVVEGNKHHANVYSCVVGRSSRARKGTSLGRIKDLMRDVIPPTMSGLSTGEGLVQELRDASLKPTKDGSSFDTLPGVDDKRLWIIESELARTLNVIKRDGNTLSSILRDAWDDGGLRVATKSNPLTATDAHVGMTSHITMDELAKTLNAQETFNGFANRFLFVVVKRSKLLPDGGDDLVLDDLRQRLATAIDKAKRIGRMTRSSECRELWRKAYPFLVAEKSGTYDAITSRAEAITLRLSMLYALLDGSSVIEVEHLKAALALWCYCDQSSEYLFAKGSTTGQVTRDKILALLNEKSSSGNVTTTNDNQPPVTNNTQSKTVEELDAVFAVASETVTTKAATLVELFNYRNVNSGRFEQRADGVIVLVCDGTTVPPAIVQAVKVNQANLKPLVSIVNKPQPAIDPKDEILSDEQWEREIADI